jgi:hypothetical protein
MADRAKCPSVCVTADLGKPLDGLVDAIEGTVKNEPDIAPVAADSYEFACQCKAIAADAAVTAIGLDTLHVDSYFHGARSVRIRS